MASTSIAALAHRIHVYAVKTNCNRYRPQYGGCLTTVVGGTPCQCRLKIQNSLRTRIVRFYNNLLGN